MLLYLFPPIKKVLSIFFAVTFLLSLSSAFAEVSQEEQQRAAQRAYQASAASHNEVANTGKKTQAQVKKALNKRTRATGKGATVAVRG